MTRSILIISIVAVSLGILTGEGVVTVVMLFIGLGLYMVMS